MRFYKEVNFRETQMGRIPADWESVKLEKICEKAKAGGTPLTTNKKYWDGSLPFVKIEDMTLAGKYLTETKASISEEGLSNSSAWLVPENSLLIAMYGSMGEVSINRIPVTTNQAILDIVPHNRDDVEFLYYWYSFFKPKWKKYAKPTTQANLTAEILRNSLIPLPSQEERQTITRILGVVDLAVAKTDEVIAKTERLKKGLMQTLLTRGIGHKEYKQTPIGKTPTKWEVEEIKDLGELQYGYTTSATNENTGTKFLRVTDIKDDGQIKWDEIPYCLIDEKDYEKYALEEGDILFARIGATAGKTGFVDRKIKGIFASYLIRLKISKENVFPKFVFYFTQSSAYWLRALREREGQLKKGINATMLSKFQVPVPPVPEQQKIAEIISAVDQKLELERHEKAKLERIKQGLMDLLLTGKIRIRED